MAKNNAAEIWGRYATNIVKATTVPSGHYLQEECPAETYTEMSGFFR